jgi:hypothetical protein
MIPAKMFNISLLPSPLPHGHRRRAHIFEEIDEESAVSLCKKKSAKIADLRPAFKRGHISLNVRCAECEKLFSGLSVERTIT